MLGTEARGAGDRAGRGRGRVSRTRACIADAGVYKECGKVLQTHSAGSTEHPA
jgi:hypothetical protein